MIKKPADLSCLNDFCFRYKVDFLRRLFRLEKTLFMFFLTGRPGNLFPHLFSVYTALWSSSNVRRSDSALKSFPADLVFEENNGRNEGTREPVRSSLTAVEVRERAGIIQPFHEGAVHESGNEPIVEEVPESPAYGMY